MLCLLREFKRLQWHVLSLTHGQPRTVHCHTYSAAIVHSLSADYMTLYVHTLLHSTRYKIIFVTRLPHYDDTRQHEWDVFVQPSTYACNTQVQRFTKTTSFLLVFIRHPHRIIMFENSTALAPDVYHAVDPQTLKMKLLARIKASQTPVGERFVLAQGQCKQTKTLNFVLLLRLSLAKWSKLTVLFLSLPPPEGAKRWLRLVATH